MSLPCEIGPMPAATAAPAPPLDPPAVMSDRQGLRVRPCSALSVNQRIEKPGVLVRPMTMAPARRRLATTGLSPSAIRSRKATMPLSVGQPRWSVLTLVVTGTPCSGPTAWPAATARSAASAAASASSASGSTTALIRGLTASIRSRQDWTASRADTCRDRISQASSTPSSFHSSVADAGLMRPVPQPAPRPACRAGTTGTAG